MADEKVTKTDIAKVATKVEAVKDAIVEVKNKVRETLKNSDLSLEDKDLLVEIKAQQTKIETMLLELLEHVSQQTKAVIEEIRSAEKRLESDFNSILETKKVIKLKPWGWWSWFSK